MKIIIGNPKFPSMAAAFIHSTPLLNMKKRIYWPQTRFSRWPPRPSIRFTNNSPEFRALLGNLGSELNHQSNHRLNDSTKSSSSSYSSSKSSSNSSSKFSKIASPDKITTSDRRALELSVKGPVNLEDVKIAYRTCALKWHPDHHQGVAKEFAEQKFKACNAAYESICKKLSAR